MSCLLLFFFLLHANFLFDPVSVRLRLHWLRFSININRSLHIQAVDYSAEVLPKQLCSRVERTSAMDVVGVDVKNRP